MIGLATTPEPPYYAVIFSSKANVDDQDGYANMAEAMVALAQRQDGFLGIETARGAIGITVSYWRDLDSIGAWRANAEHAVAQKLGRARWYQAFELRVARVERAYGFRRTTD